MIRRPPRSTRTVTLLPDTALFRAERSTLLERHLVRVMVPLCTPASGEHRIDRAFDTSAIAFRHELRSDFVPHHHGGDFTGLEIGRAHVRTPVTNAHPVCRLLPETKKPIPVCTRHKYS